MMNVENHSSDENFEQEIVMVATGGDKPCCGSKSACANKKAICSSDNGGCQMSDKTKEECCTVENPLNFESAEIKNSCLKAENRSCSGGGNCCDVEHGLGTALLENGDRLRHINYARAISVFTVLYSTMEGALAVGFGSYNGSSALFFLGLDSLIEVTSGLLVLYRFHDEVYNTREMSLKFEKNSTLAIGTLLCLLCFSTLIDSSIELAQGHSPTSAVASLAIAGAGVVLFSMMYVAKKKLGGLLHSSTVTSDATCSINCVRLSLVVVVSAIIFKADPSLWWVDSSAALVVALIIGYEGWGTVSYAMSPNFSGGCHDCHAN